MEPIVFPPLPPTSPEDLIRTNGQLTDPSSIEWTGKASPPVDIPPHIRCYNSVSKYYTFSMYHLATALVGNYVTLFF